MPIRLAIPLPGPFVWIGKSHRKRTMPANRFHSPWYWLLGIWALEAGLWVTWWVTIGALWLAWVLIRLAGGLLLVALGMIIQQLHDRPGKHRKAT